MFRKVDADQNEKALGKKHYEAKYCTFDQLELEIDPRASHRITK